MADFLVSFPIHRWAHLLLHVRYSNNTPSFQVGCVPFPPIQGDAPSARAQAAMLNLLAGAQHAFASAGNSALMCGGVSAYGERGRLPFMEAVLPFAEALLPLMEAIVS
eukprot:2586355-Rhodomonas_salina.2